MAVTNQELFNIFLANPNMSDAQIVSLMEQRGISPAQVSQTFGIPIAEIESRYNAALPFVNPEIEERVVDMGEGTRSEYYIKGTNIQADAPTFTETSPTTGLTESSAPQLQANNFTVYDPQAKGEYVYSPEGKLIGFNPGERGSGFGSLLNEVYQDNKGVIIPALTLGALNAYGLLGGGAGAAAGGAEAATAFDLANAGIAGGSSGFTAAELAAIDAASGATGGAGLLTQAPITNAVTNAATGALTPATNTGLLSGLPTSVTDVASKVGTGLLTNVGTKLVGDAVTGGLGLAGGVLQQQTSKEAAQTAAQNVEKATQQAVEASQFRPVGMTTRFGTSNYTYDPVTGRMTSAGYQLSPEAKAAQDRLVALAGRGLTQAEQAQQQFAPLQTGAQNLFNLGNQYISQSPQDVAQNYLNQQMALLQPSREVELANLQNRLQQQGRAGLSVAQGGTMGATTPELQALFNARAQQEAQLAANAQQFGQQNTLFGVNLLGQGANAMGQYYGGQQAAYAPYTTALGQVQNLETAAQQPLQMGAQLGQTAATAGANAGRIGLTGAQISGNLLTSPAVTNNPYAAFLGGLASPQSTLGQGLANWVTGTGYAAPTAYSAVGMGGFGTGNVFGNQDLGSFL